MVGLNPQDRLTDKTAKILQQSSLSATPAGSSSLKTLGFTESAVRRYTLIRGNLFTPDGTLPAHPLYQPQSWCGLLNPDIGALPQPPQTRFYHLPRMRISRPRPYRQQPERLARHTRSQRHLRRHATASRRQLARNFSFYGYKPIR